jgi:hypothetical protein
MLHRFTCLLALMALLSLSYRAVLTAQPIISITISSIEIVLEPGQPHQETFDIINLGNEPLSFNLDFCYPGMEPSILVVDDDGGTNNHGCYFDVQRFYTDALDSAGYQYDFYVVDWSISPEQPGPDAATMSDYNLVIWFTGETWGVYGMDTITPTDEQNLGQYLDDGGNLFLSSQDYFYANYYGIGPFYVGQFPYDYLGVTYTNQDNWIQPPHCNGGDSSFARGMDFICQSPYPDQVLYTDMIQGGTPLFVIGDLPAANQFEGATFKSAFTTLSFEALVDGTPPSTKAQFMGNLIDWLDANEPGSDANDEPWVLLLPESGSIEPGESQLITANFTMPDTAEPGDEYEGSIIINNNSPNDPVIIPIIVYIEFSTAEIHRSTPSNFALYQNYPNPFNPNTDIKFDLPHESHVSLSIYNLLGQKTAMLLDRKIAPGTFSVSFDGSSLPSGVYFYRITAGEFTDIKKMVLMK